jgi:hypothetical protein
MSIASSFKEIATANGLRLVYRHVYNAEWGYTVARGNCILWNGQDKITGLQMLEKLAAMKW